MYPYLERNRNLESITAHRLFYYMQAGTRTQLSRGQADRSIQNSEIQQLEVSSKHSSQNQPEVRHRRELDIRSEGLRRTKKSLQSVDYKRELLKLMIAVKLEEFGYKQKELNGIIDFEMAAIEDIESIEGKDLDLKAIETTLRIVSGIFEEGSIRIIPRFMAQSSSSQSRIAPLQVNLEALPAQRAEEMGMEEERRNMPEILCNICYTTSHHFCEQQCGHTFCIDCIKGYLRQNLRSGNYIIKCPQYDCPQYVSVAVIKIALSDKELQRFLYFKEKNEKENNPENKFCSKPDCGELLDKAKDRLKCKKCETTYCQICLQYYHHDDPCDIVLRNSLQNTYKSFQIKKCPSCKSPIQKSEGCNHMTCKKCKFQFCWLCLKRYSRHHYKYYNCFGCPGMQFQDEEELVTERFKQLLFYFLMPFIVSLVLFCYVAAIPLYMLGCFLYKPCSWAENERDFLQSTIVNHLCCCLGSCLSRMFLWILYQPRAALYAVFLSPIKMTMMFCGQVCKIFQ